MDEKRERALTAYKEAVGIWQNQVPIPGAKYDVDRFIVDRIIRAICEHEYELTPYRIGDCVIYRCVKCGDEYEKDVS